MNGHTPDAGRPLTIGFNGAMLRAPHTGSGQYSAALLTALAAFPAVRVRVLSPVPLADYPGAVVVAPPRFVRGERARKVWWEQIGLEIAARRARADLIHTPYFAAPVLGRLPHVVTVHDVIPLVLPEYAGGRGMAAYLRLVAAGTRRAAQVLADSDHSRQDAIRLLRLDPRRVTTVPLAAGPEFAAPPNEGEIARVRGKLGLGAGRVVFNVGGLDVRKNVATLLRAFALALPELGADVTLVIGGRAHGNVALYPDPEPLARDLGITERVRFPGAVSAAEKLALYRTAAVYVAPSRYEGFGLTPLEAMACGTPVIAADASSTPEVTGEAALLVPPDDTEGFARALVRVLSDDAMAQRMAATGRARAAGFTWGHTAAATVAVYERAMRGGDGAAQARTERAAEAAR